MEKFFSASRYFELKDFPHKEIFENSDYIWNVLKDLCSYLENNKELGNHKTEIPEGVIVENEKSVSIGKNCSIEKGSYIKGPCIIGDNCTIRHGSYLRENVLIGNNCIIGHSSEIKNSILLNDAKASHFNYVGDSIIGNSVNLGAGVILANFRLDEKIISFFFNGKKISTNLKKFGAIIGDNASIGCNSVINPATFIGKNTISYPLSSIKGIIDENSTIKNNSNVENLNNVTSFAE